MLSRAEALYYEAKFNDAIALLTPFDESLKADAGRIKERTSVKLQLALGYLALKNELDKAKSNFVEMCTLDSECSDECGPVSAQGSDSVRRGQEPGPQGCRRTGISGRHGSIQKG